MEIRLLKCASCKGYSNVKSAFNGNETYNCVSCGALNQINSKSGKSRYKIASILTILMFLFLPYYCMDISALEYGYYNFHEELFLTLLLPWLILCTITYFGTLLVAKVFEWIVD